MLVSNLASLLLNKLLFLSIFTWLLRLDKSLQFILTSLDIIAHLSVSPNLVRLLLDESCLLVCELFQFLLNLTLNLSLDVLRANINLIFLFILVFFKVRNLCLNVVHGWCRLLVSRCCKRLEVGLAKDFSGSTCWLMLRYPNSRRFRREGRSFDRVVAHSVRLGWSRRLRPAPLFAWIEISSFLSVARLKMLNRAIDAHIRDCDTKGLAWRSFLNFVGIFGIFIADVISDIDLEISNHGVTLTFCITVKKVDLAGFGGWSIVSAEEERDFELHMLLVQVHHLSLLLIDLEHAEVGCIFGTTLNAGLKITISVRSHLHLCELQVDGTFGLVIFDGMTKCLETLLYSWHSVIKLLL